MANIVPIYKSGAYNYAREHGETQQLRASLDANHAVQDYLRNDISKYYVGGERFNATVLMQDLKKEFGLDRAMHVLLASVHDWDGRFSTATVERAKTEFYISTSTDNNPGDFEKDFCYTDMHPVYLDEVIKKGLQMEREFAQIRENTANVKSFEDFKIGETYLNHNGLCYTVLDKGMTYFDEPYIKVQSVTDIPEYAWTCWAVHPQIGEDGTLEWAYSKERDMTIDPEKNINNENLEEKEMEETLKVTAHMTYIGEPEKQVKDTNSNFVGLASIAIADNYVISGIAVFQSTNDKYPNPYYASMPEVKQGDGNHHQVVFATAEAREAMSNAVSGAFLAAKEQGKDSENHYPSFSSALAAKPNAQELSVVIKGDTYQRDFKANANVTLYGQFEVKGVKLITSKDGNDFISMPSQKGKDNEFYDLVFPITAEARDKIFAEVNAKLADRAKIIGNVKYSDIKDKAYLVIGGNDIKDVSAKLESAGLHYSGKPNDNGAYTITVERADIAAVEEITKAARENAKPDRDDVQSFINETNQSLDQSKEMSQERG